MRAPDALILATAAAVIAVIAAIAGWVRAVRAEVRVVFLAVEVRDLNGAVQALHEDLDQTRAVYERAVQVAPKP